MTGTETTPWCFGKEEEWDPKDIDCTGGYNPAFKGEDGSKFQPRCAFFEACKGRVSLKRIESLQQQGHTIKPEALVQAKRLAEQRPLTTTAYVPSKETTKPEPAPAPVPAGGLSAETVQQLQSILLPWLMGGGLKPFTPPAQGNVQSPYYPAPTAEPPAPLRREMLSPSPAVSPYLAVPERRRKGERFVQPLGREMARAALKAVFQTGANFFDFVPFHEEDD